MRAQASHTEMRPGHTAEAEAKDNLPPLRGTDKQGSKATRVRYKEMRLVAEEEDAHYAAINRFRDAGKIALQYLDGQIRVIASERERIAARDSTARWIAPRRSAADDFGDAVAAGLKAANDAMRERLGHAP